MIHAGTANKSVNRSEGSTSAGLHASLRIDLERHIVLAVDDGLQDAALNGTVELQVDSCLDGQGLKGQGPAGERGFTFS